METGLVHIYTGAGKGKTTSAVGLGVRALGHGLNVCYSFFNKVPKKYGYTEVYSLEKLGAKTVGFTGGHPSFDKTITEGQMQKQTQQGIETLDKLIRTEHFDMLIMDEILISVRDRSLEEDALIQFVKNKPKSLELIMTGRGATPRLIELADYVSDIQCVKHPMDKGIASRKGIEY